MNVHIRAATGEDIEAIYTIDRASFTQPWARASFETALADVERSLSLVAVQNDQIVAFGIAWNVGDEGEIATLAVDAAARGKGLGETMVRALVDSLRARGVRGVFLEVRPTNAGARRLYHRTGFQEVGRRPNYYADGETAIVMKLELDE